MEYNNIIAFANAVKAEVALRLDSTYTVEVKEVTKNNDQHLVGISATRKGDNLTPTVYLEAFYDAYREGIDDVDTIADRVIEVLTTKQDAPVFDVNSFRDWEFVKSKVCYKVVNAGKNGELLSEAPHIHLIGDLVAVFFVPVEMVSGSPASVTIRNSHCQSWGDITDEELYELAKVNTPRIFPADVKSMWETLREMMPEEMLPPCESVPMTVCSNADKCHGANVMFYDGVLADFAEKNDGDVFILPSSVHEVLFLPAKGMDEAFLANLVNQVNNTEVDAQEYLSDHVFVYRRDTGVIEIAA